MYKKKLCKTQWKSCTNNINKNRKKNTKTEIESFFFFCTNYEQLWNLKTATDLEDLDLKCYNKFSWKQK